MKLLLDNNVSPRLVRRLGELYPGTTHVRSLNLQSAADETIWQEAAAGGFIAFISVNTFSSGVPRGNLSLGVE